MQRFLFLLLCLALACPMPLVAARGTWTAPKLVNFYLNWKIEDADLERLSRWDLVVLDMDIAWSAPEDIRALRKANPNIKVIAYVSAGELSASRSQGHEASPGHQLASRIPEEMFMHSASGSRMSWWAGAELMNATDLGPSVNGKRWADALPDFVRTEMMSTGLWDGVFLDGAYSDIAWFFGNSIDPNSDGIPDPSERVNAAWQAGMSRLLRNMRRAVGPRGLILVNSSTIYRSQVNGVLVENFPRYGWTGPQTEMLEAERVNVSPSITAYNTNTEDRETPEDYRLMRYGLTNAMLGNGFFSFDAGPTHHARTWWYDEYDAPLGEPVGKARRVDGNESDIVPGVWMREFEKGIVVVNSTTSTQRAVLPGAFEQLYGIQDPRANTGEIVRELEIPPEDGRVLLRSVDVTDIREGGFVNGGYLRPYRWSGAQAWNGFFAQRTDLPSGADVLVTRFTSAGGLATITAREGEIDIRSGGTRTRFHPFGAAYTGKLWMAVGNVRGDAMREVVVGREGSLEVRVFSRSGVELDRWSVDDPAFLGGVRVALIDLDGDGKNEIVTGAGPGRAPLVQIRTADGALWGDGFAAFDETEHGGVTVTVDDIDGNGRTEILVGSGEGAIPRIRVFDPEGRILREIVLGTQPLLSGLIVTTSDLDEDGLREILAASDSSF
jgi:hypothetical protein